MNRSRTLIPVFLALAACEGSTGPRVATQVRIDRAAVTIDDGASTRLVATVLDQEGDTLAVPPGATVLWTSSVEPVATVDQTGLVTANAPGTTTIRAILGELIGESVVTVRQVASEVRFNTPQDWDGYAGQPLPEILAVLVDRHGLGVPGVAVAFQVVEGGGTVAPVMVTTGSAGEVRTTWTLSAAPGPQRLRASAPGVANAELRARSVAGPVATIHKLGGDGQTGTVGTTLPIPLSVRVIDPVGNPIPNVAVAWWRNGVSVAPGSVTDAEGVATTQWTLGPEPGPQTVHAIAGKGVRSEDFTAEAVPE